MFKEYGVGRPPAPGAHRPRFQSPAAPALRPGSEQKYPSDPLAGPSSSGSVPSLNTVTTSHDLQWMVQPTLMGASPGIPPYPRPYRCSRDLATLPGIRPGVIRAAGPIFTSRRRHSDNLTPEEEERRRLRRERNKLAAAKCRNRRKELTDSLQAETDQLESEQSGLQKEIAELQKQKDRLELILEAHRPVCKIPGESSGDDEESGSQQAASSAPLPVKPESPPGPSIPRRAAPVPPRITLPPTGILEPEALHTPTLMSTPSLTPFTPSLVFTYPTPGDPDTPSTSSFSQEPCSSAHRRSSSGDHSSDSLNSPTLLAL